jgi:hypothetical protein
MSFTRSTLALVAATALFAACGEDPVTPDDPTLTLTVTPATLSIAQNETGESAVTVMREDTEDAVTVTVSGGGTGVAAAVQGVAHDGDETTATVVVTVSGAAEPGEYTVTVKAANGDADDVTKPITVTVTEAEGGGEA